MTEQPPTPSNEPPTPTPTSPPRRISRQDARKLNILLEAEQFLEQLLAMTDFITALATRGRDLVYIQQLQVQAQIVRAAFNSRDLAIDTEDHAAQALKTAVAAVRTAHQNYAKILRRYFKDPDTRAALRLNGRLTSDLQLFIANLDAAYKNNLNTPEYLAISQSVGYDTPQLNTLVTNANALLHQKALQEQAHTNAVNATQKRNEVYAAFYEEMMRLRTIAEVVSQDNPSWQQILR